MNNRHDENRRGLRAEDRNRRGMVLFTVVTMVALISLVAASLVAVNMAELRSSTYDVHTKRAFYNAEGGIRHVVNRINRDIRDGVLTLNDQEGSDVVSVSYASPHGDGRFDEVTELRRIADRTWVFTVTGRYGDAQSVIEVAVRRPNIFSNLGIFGGEGVEVKPNSEIYSYRSADMLPLPENSTGLAIIGSNGPLDIHSQGGAAVFLDGYFLLGQRDDGLWHVVHERYESHQVPRIEPDPLGAQGGPLDAAFDHHRNHNDNAAAGLAGAVLNPGGGETVTLPGGSYYFEEIDLRNHSVLEADGTPDNPVVIYLDGEFKAAPNHDFINNGTPASLYIFSRSDKKIEFKPNQDFGGFIYAPYSEEIYVQPNGSLRGVFWGNEVNLWPNAVVFIDTTLLDQFQESRVEIINWHRQI